MLQVDDRTCYCRRSRARCGHVDVLLKKTYLQSNGLAISWWLNTLFFWALIR